MACAMARAHATCLGARPEPHDDAPDTHDRKYGMGQVGRDAVNRCVRSTHRTRVWALQTVPYMKPMGARKVFSGVSFAAISFAVTWGSAVHAEELARGANGNTAEAALALAGECSGECCDGTPIRSEFTQNKQLCKRLVRLECVGHGGPHFAWWNDILFKIWRCP